MAKLMMLFGAKQVINNLKRQGANAGRGVAAGLKAGGLFLQRESQLIVPVDLGNLINSAFTRAEGEGVDTEVEVGYTAEYAVYVHENLDARHEPGKQAKYLEQPAREKRAEILKIVEEKAKQVMGVT